MAARGRGLTARRRGRKEEGGRRKKEEGRRRKETTDIKSNNPHLTGGEKHHLSKENGLLANSFNKNVEIIY